MIWLLMWLPTSLSLDLFRGHGIKRSNYRRVRKSFHQIPSSTCTLCFERSSSYSAVYKLKRDVCTMCSQAILQQFLEQQMVKKKRKKKEQTSREIDISNHYFCEKFLQFIFAVYIKIFINELNSFLNKIGLFINAFELYRSNRFSVSPKIHSPGIS